MLETCVCSVALVLLIELSGDMRKQRGDESTLTDRPISMRSVWPNKRHAMQKEIQASEMGYICYIAIAAAGIADQCLTHPLPPLELRPSVGS